MVCKCTCFEMSRPPHPSRLGGHKTTGDHSQIPRVSGCLRFHWVDVCKQLLYKQEQTQTTRQRIEITQSRMLGGQTRFPNYLRTPLVFYQILTQLISTSRHSSEVGQTRKPNKWRYATVFSQQFTFLSCGNSGPEISSQYVQCTTNCCAMIEQFSTLIILEAKLETVAIVQCRNPKRLNTLIIASHDPRPRTQA